MYDTSPSNGIHFIRRLSGYPGSVIRFISEGAQCLNTSSEKPPLIIPGVANRTQGPGAFIIERSKLLTATFKPRLGKKIKYIYIYQYISYQFIQKYISTQAIRNYYTQFSFMAYFYNMELLSAVNKLM